MAQDELRRLLDSIAANDGEQIRLASIARRVEIRSRELVAVHQEFVSTFDSLMRTRDVNEVQLSRAIDAHSERRKWLRDDLLRLQDELHDAVSPEEWTEVVKTLNRTGRAIGRTSISGGA